MDEPYQITEDISEEDLSTLLKSWMKESESYHDHLLQFQSRALDYYEGNQTDLQEVPEYLSNTVINRIFEAVETVVPVITGSAHAFVAEPGEDSEVAVQQADKLQKILTIHYERLNMREQLERVARDMMLKRFGVITWEWDAEKDDVSVRTVDPRNIYVPKRQLPARDLPYIIELQAYTRADLEDTDFDKDKIQELKKGRGSFSQKTPGTANRAKEMADENLYFILKTVTPEYTVYSQHDIILQKQQNPYWDFKGEEGENGMTFSNYFDKPTINYVFFTPFVTGDAPLPSISLVEAALSIQDDINTQKRQITNNLIRMGNGQVIADSEIMDDEAASTITNEPGAVITGKGAASEGRIRRDPGVPLPNAHFANLQDSLAAFDNVFGTHGALRGAGSAKTLGGQVLNRQQDLSRVEQLTRELNRGVRHVAEGLTQLMRQFYTEEHSFRHLGEDGNEFITISRNDLSTRPNIIVKSGVPVTLDPTEQYNQAIQLWQLGALPPETLFERLNFPSPQRTSQALLAWKQGQLVFESQLRQQENTQAARANAAFGGAAQAAQGGGQAAGGEAGGGRTDRGVETRSNAITRVLEDIAGRGRANLSQTPKTENT